MDSIELIYPQFKLGESVPISKVYPLMAHADTVRAPVTKKVISGIKGIIKKHPIELLAGLGAAKKTQAVPSNELNFVVGDKLHVLHTALTIRKK